MFMLNKKMAKKSLGVNSQSYASVCNSCACGGGTGSCNTTCKGCKDKGDNVAEARNAYNK